MGQGPDTDAVNPRGGNATDGREIHSAGGLKLDLGGEPISNRDRFAEQIASHVVEQNDVWSGDKGRLQLADTVDLDFYHRRIREFDRAGSYEGFGKRHGLARIQ